MATFTRLAWRPSGTATRSIRARKQGLRASSCPPPLPAPATASAFSPVAVAVAPRDASSPAMPRSTASSTSSVRAGLPHSKCSNSRRSFSFASAEPASVTRRAAKAGEHTTVSSPAVSTCAGGQSSGLGAAPSSATAPSSPGMTQEHRSAESRSPTMVQPSSTSLPPSGDPSAWSPSPTAAAGTGAGASLDSCLAHATASSARARRSRRQSSGLSSSSTTARAVAMRRSSLPSRYR